MDRKLVICPCPPIPPPRPERKPIIAAEDDDKCINLARKLDRQNKCIKRCENEDDELDECRRMLRDPSLNIDTVDYENSKVAGKLVDYCDLVPGEMGGPISQEESFDRQGPGKSGDICNYFIYPPLECGDNLYCSTKDGQLGSSGICRPVSNSEEEN